MSGDACSSAEPADRDAELEHRRRAHGVVEAVEREHVDAAERVDAVRDVFALRAGVDDRPRDRRLELVEHVAAPSAARRSGGRLHATIVGRVAAPPAAAAFLRGRGVAHLQPRRDAVAELLARREHDVVGIEAELGGEVAREQHRRRAVADDRDHDAERRSERSARAGSRVSDSTSAPFSSLRAGAARDQPRGQAQAATAASRSGR